VDSRAERRAAVRCRLTRLIARSPRKAFFDGKQI
jgi:hypothetical protein